nr:bZIP transcription factor 28-like isoform X3 [Physcomitrium patens]|eukprot:XP_024392781.1 bZIP transcription factor 28-like isoform X3 [Physcomitrella patens]
MSFQNMERKIEIPDIRGDDGETLEKEDPEIATLSSSEASVNWENISEDWVSLFLDPATFDEHATPLPSDLESYSRFDSTLRESNDRFSPQELLADSLLLHSIDDQLSSDLVLQSSVNVVEDIFGKDGSSTKGLKRADLKHSEGEPRGQNSATVSNFSPAPQSNATQTACASTSMEVYASSSPASSLTQVSGDSSPGMEVDLWKNKEANSDLLITLEQRVNGEVSSRSESPTSPSSAMGVENGCPNVKKLQSEGGRTGSRDVSSTGSAVRTGIPSTALQSDAFDVRQLRSIDNSFKVGFLGRSGDTEDSVEDREESNKLFCREYFQSESFKLQNLEVPEDQQSDRSDGERKADAGVEDDEKRRARLMRNRESAQLSRQRKKMYVDELEGKLRTMTATVAELNATISHLTAENVNLRRQLGYYYPAPGVCPPRPGMPMQVLPMGPYPGMVAGRPIYSGGQMPPVPIPRIKAKIPARSTKRAKSEDTKEGGDRKRTKLKAAGAASMAVMGLLCVAMLFSSFDQGLNGSGGVEDYTRIGNVRIGGRVLTSWDEAVNPLNNTGLSSSDTEPGWVPLQEGEYGPEREGVANIHMRLAAEKVQDEAVKSQISKAGLESSARQSVDGNEDLGISKEKGSQLPPDYFSSGKVPLQMRREIVSTNTSQSYAATVFVPGANGLVKVDGNLIIQAVMAGDKAAKKQSKNKQIVGGKKKGPVSKNLPVKVLDNLAPRETKVVQNATTGPFVIARPLPERAKSVFGTNNPVSPVLHAGALQQWMLGGLHGLSTGFTWLIYEEPILCERIRSDNREKMPLLSRNEENSEASMSFWATLSSLIYNKPLQKKFHDKSTCSVPTIRPVLNTGMCTELFQFDTAAATTSPEQGSTPEPKNMAESVAARAAQGSPHNITSTLSVPDAPRSRRDPFAVPLPPVKPKSAAEGDGVRNDTDPRVKNIGRDHMHGRNLRDEVSSMVVSVMAGPEEYGDSRKQTKGLSRIFVVILVQNQKYVTYSCMLPSGGPQGHVVAA